MKAFFGISRTPGYGCKEHIQSISKRLDHQKTENFGLGLDGRNEARSYWEKRVWISM